MTTTHPSPPTQDPVSPRRRRWRWAVAAVAVVIAVPALVVVLGRDGEPDPDRLRLGFQGDPPVTGADRWVPPVNLAMLDVPGWTLDADVHSSIDGVFTSYSHAPGVFSVSWLTADQYAEYSFVGSQIDVGSMEVLGVEGRYLDLRSAFSVLTPPEGGFFLSIEANGIDEREFAELVRGLRPVETLEVPPEIVDPTEVDAVVAGLYAGAELPDGFMPLPMVGWNTRDSLVRMVTGDIGCGWARRYVEGDQAQREAVVTVLERHDRWPLVVAEPDGSDPFVDLLSLIASEDDPEITRGCPGGGPHGQS